MSAEGTKGALCDVVMKGGVTSGIVYPSAICAIAKTFSFKNIGGTSAGAIAAVMTAAAQRSRILGNEHGFDVLAAMPDELSKNNLLGRLFRPNHRTRALFHAITALFGRTSPAGRCATIFTAHPFASVVGAMPAAILFWTSRRTWYDGVLALLLLFGGALCAAGITFAYDLLAGLKRNFLGLMTGISDDDPRAPALVTWLETKLRAAAGIADPATPLTFSMLWDARSQDLGRLRARPARYDINLEMITTNLTFGRPFKFPFDTSRFFFRPDEMKRFFPATVVQWMIAAAREPDGEEERGRFTRYKKQGYYPLPPMGDLPVIVATRMSLSFPILFSAVPLHCADFTQKENQRTKDRDVLPKLEQSWFSDGGLSSNFPIALFDGPIPRWPTFAINLGPFHPDYPEVADEAKNVYMPASNGAGMSPHFTPIADVPTFLMAIFDTMQNWNDTTQMTLPGYRDRIVTVHLTDSEGGLNLDMPARVLERLSKRGTAAGALIAERFEDAAGLEPSSPMNWENHEYLRLRSMMGTLRQYLAELAQHFDSQMRERYRVLLEEHSHGLSYPIGPPDVATILELLDELKALGIRFESAVSLLDNLPNPPPKLVIRPDLSSST